VIIVSPLVIPENFSYNMTVTDSPAPKRKRGRPRSFRREVADQLDEVGVGPENVHTVRSKVNWSYLVHATTALNEDPNHQTRWPWLAERDGGFPRQSVLYELGRVGNSDDIRWMADQICTGKFTAVEAVRRIRAWRLGQPILPDADRDSLADALLKAIQQYHLTHQGLTADMIREAFAVLQFKGESLSENFSDIEDEE
jgi:hypothetical protein